MKAKKISKKLINPIIESLLNLKQFEIDTADNGEFIEQTEREETNGRYVKVEDVLLLIGDLECVKDSLEDICNNKKESK